MAEIVSILSSSYISLLETLPFWAKNFINLFLISLVILIYSVLIWKFYRFIAKKNIFELNLSKGFSSEGTKFLASMLNFMEYVVILPIMVFLWFGVFTLFLVLLTENLEISAILIISATVVTAIRMAAYYKEDLSRDLAKLLPFTLLGVFVTQYTVFNFERVISQLSLIPSFLNHILIYLFFVLVMEMILRLFDLFFQAAGLSLSKTKEDEDEDFTEQI